MAWRLSPSRSCDPDSANKLSFPLPKEAPHKIWLNLAKSFQRRRVLKKNEQMDGRTTDAGPWVYYKLAFGSVALKINSTNGKRTLISEQKIHHANLSVS